MVMQGVEKTHLATMKSKSYKKPLTGCVERLLEERRCLAYDEMTVSKEDSLRNPWWVLLGLQLKSHEN